MFRRESCVVNCKAHAISGFCENLQILPWETFVIFGESANMIFFFENVCFSLIFSEFVYFSVEISENVCFS